MAYVGQNQGCSPRSGLSMEGTICANTATQGKEQHGCLQEAPWRGAADGGSFLGRMSCMWSSARVCLPQAEGRTQYDTHTARRERAYAQALAQAFDVSYRLEHPGPTHIMPRSGAFISVHLHAPPQHVDLRTRRAGPQKPISRLSGAIYARSCIRTSENTPSRHSVESHLAGCHRVLRVSS